MSAFKYFIKTERVAQAMRATTRAHFQGERPRVKTTQVNACMATVDHNRQGQAAHRRYNLHTMVEVASGKGHP